MAERFVQAEVLCRRLLALAPASAEAHIALAEIMSASARTDEAISVLQQLAAIRPGDASHRRRLGNLLLARGNVDAAVAELEKAIELDPTGSRGHNSLGEAYFAQGELLRATICYRNAIERDPQSASAYNNLGRALHELGRDAEAIDCLNRAINLNPALFQCHIGLGNVLGSQGQTAAAAACYHRATQLNPLAVEAWMARGRMLRALGQLVDAQECFAAGLVKIPDDPGLMYELAMVLGARGDYGAARHLLARIEELAPDYPYLLGYRLLADLSSAEWDGLADRVARMELEIERGGRSCSPFVCLLTITSPRVQRQCADAYVADRYPAHARRPQTAPSGDTRLHIGYVSSDFHDHATAHLMAGLFELHDRARYQLTALSIGSPADDWMSRRLRRAFGHIEELHTLSDAQCAERIAALGIQILIDLKGHTYNARSGIFARRPAPLQVSYLGYPGTMGGEFIDYLIADPHVVPPTDAAHYSEKIVHLATCYQVNDRLPPIDAKAPPRRECGLPEQGFVFCCFNAVQKINPDSFASWMRILERVDGSVLWLLEDKPEASNNLRKAAMRHGVNADRLVFAPRMPHDAHLARHQNADLFLDTLPYNAHTSGSDALASGCPLLTILGKTFAGRVGASLLHAVGAPDLITRSRQEYEDRAVHLAMNVPALAELKQRLRALRSTAPLFDTDRTRCQLEQAYAAMWARHAAGLPPESFAIAPP